ncbi:hypothetical protein BHM03_00031059 [Ensete ventricosum]|nr:hypothetical protein BHM03_00031059 [Ensete ventricosum]
MDKWYPLSGPSFDSRKLFPRLVSNLDRPLNTPAEPVGLRQLHRHVAPRVLIVVLLQRLNHITCKPKTLIPIKNKKHTTNPSICARDRADANSGEIPAKSCLTGILLIHELKGLLLVAEPTAVVVVTSGEGMAEGLLVEILVDGGAASAVTTDLERRPSARCVSDSRGNNEAGKDPRDLRRDRHRKNRGRGRWGRCAEQSWVRGVVRRSLAIYPLACHLAISMDFPKRFICFPPFLRLSGFDWVRFVA